MAPRQLVIAVEGSSSLGPSWPILRKEYIDKLVRAFCGYDNTGQKLTLPPGEMALIVYNSHGNHSEVLLQQTAWIDDMDQFLCCLKDISFVGGDFGEAAVAEALAEALAMCCPGPTVAPPPVSGIERQKHCVLVAASPPHRLATPLPRPPLASLNGGHITPSGSSEGDAQLWWLADAAMLAQSFPQCSVSLSIIAPRQIASLRTVYNHGKRNPRAAEPSADASKQYPQHLVLLSEGFLAARVALHRAHEGTRAMASAKNVQAGAVPVTSASSQGLGHHVTPSSRIQNRAAAPVGVQVKKEPGQQAPVGAAQGLQQIKQAPPTNSAASAPGRNSAIGGAASAIPLAVPPRGLTPELAVGGMAMGTHGMSAGGMPVSQPQAGLDPMVTAGAPARGQVMLQQPNSAQVGGMGVSNNLGKPAGMGLGAQSTNGMPTSGSLGPGSSMTGMQTGTVSGLHHRSQQTGGSLGIAHQGPGVAGRSTMGVGGGFAVGQHSGPAGANVGMMGMTQMGTGPSNSSGMLVSNANLSQDTQQQNQGGGSRPQPAAQGQPAQHAKYTKLWEGMLAGQRSGNPVSICKVEGYRQHTSPENLAADWPDTMKIVRLISQEYMNNKEYQGKAELLVFRPLNHHTFLPQMAEKKLCAVIQLPSQTLLLASVPDRPGRLIGMLFPQDVVVLHPHSGGSNQQAPQPQQQQQQQQQVQRARNLQAPVGNGIQQPGYGSQQLAAPNQQNTTSSSSMQSGLYNMM